MTKRRDRARRRSRERTRARREGRRRSALVWAAGLILLAAVFFAGLALGRALEQAPRPGNAQTLLRTFTPGTTTPSETVTVTVSNP